MKGNDRENVSSLLSKCQNFWHNECFACWPRSKKTERSSLLLVCNSWNFKDSMLRLFMWGGGKDLESVSSSCQIDFFWTRHVSLDLRFSATWPLAHLTKLFCHLQLVLSQKFIGYWLLISFPILYCRTDCLFVVQRGLACHVICRGIVTGVWGASGHSMGPARGIGSRDIESALSSGLNVFSNDDIGWSQPGMSTKENRAQLLQQLEMLWNKFALKLYDGVFPKWKAQCHVPWSPWTRVVTGAKPWPSAAGIVRIAICAVQRKRKLRKNSIWLGKTWLRTRFVKAESEVKRRHVSYGHNGQVIRRQKWFTLFCFPWSKLPSVAILRYGPPHSHLPEALGSLFCNYMFMSFQLGCKQAIVPAHTHGYPKNLRQKRQKTFASSNWLTFICHGNFFCKASSRNFTRPLL